MKDNSKVREVHEVGWWIQPKYDREWDKIDVKVKYRAEHAFFIFKNRFLLLGWNRTRVDLMMSDFEAVTYLGRPLGYLFMPPPTQIHQIFYNWAWPNVLYLIESCDSTCTLACHKGDLPSHRCRCRCEADQCSCHWRNRWEVRKRSNRPRSSRCGS